MKHTITADDVIRAMQTEIVLASACHSAKHRAKDLKFDLSGHVYRVRTHTHHGTTSNSFSSMLDAIDKYNEFSI